MGRQLRRVALDFKWPLNKPYEGFCNPHYTAVACPHCKDYKGGSPFLTRMYQRWYGYTDFRPEERGSTPLTPDTPAVWAFAQRSVLRSPSFYGTPSDANIRREAARLCALWNNQWSHHLNQDDVDALVADGRLYDLTHDWTKETGWVAREGAVVTAEQVNEWAIAGGFGGHDSINQWIVCAAECKRLGYPTHCEHCEGQGDIWPSEEDEKRYEDWEPSEPPEGPGYQMWETVSEGSPISPVFQFPSALARYLVRNRPDDGTYESWMKMICGDGWAPSGMIVNGVMMSGVNYAGDQTPYSDEYLGRV